MIWSVLHGKSMDEGTMEKWHCYLPMTFLWNTTLHCNVVSPWLGAHTKWSLHTSLTLSYQCSLSVGKSKLHVWIVCHGWLRWIVVHAYARPKTTCRSQFSSSITPKWLHLPTVLIKILTMHWFCMLSWVCISDAYCNVMYLFNMPRVQNITFPINWDT